MSGYSRSGDSHQMEIERMTQTASEFPEGRKRERIVLVVLRAATGASPSKSVGN